MLRVAGKLLLCGRGCGIWTGKESARRRKQFRIKFDGARARPYIAVVNSRATRVSTSPIIRTPCTETRRCVIYTYNGNLFSFNCGALCAFFSSFAGVHAAFRRRRLVDRKRPHYTEYVSHVHFAKKPRLT